MPKDRREANKRYYEKHRVQREKLALNRRLEREEMLATVNETISKLNPSDVNGLLLIGSNLRTPLFGEYLREHPNAKWGEYDEYREDQQEWISERKSERFNAVQKAIEYLDEFEPKAQVWRKLFPEFFKKHEN